MDIEQLINEYESGAARINAFMQTIPEETYDFMPVKADDWSIRQHIIHLVDSENNNFVRIRSCIAQPYSNVYVTKELDWVKNLENRKESIPDFLSLFSLFRRILTAFLWTVAESDFESKYFIRDYKGEIKQITLAEEVRMCCNHVQFHIDYITRIYAEYQETLSSTV